MTLKPVWARVLRDAILAGAQFAIAQTNAVGGVNGRMHEAVQLDGRGKPDEDSRVVRDLVNNDCEAILNAEASGASFAVN